VNISANEVDRMLQDTVVQNIKLEQLSKRFLRSSLSLGCPGNPFMLWTRMFIAISART
jgi:hypothetical protein